MPVIVDKEKCIGCGLCESIAPDSFKMEDDMKAHVKSSKVDAKAKEAAESCPVQAIKVS